MGQICRRPDEMLFLHLILDLSESRNLFDSDADSENGMEVRKI